MKRVIILLLSTSLCLCGCATPIQPSFQFGKNYEVNETYSTNIGSTMVRIYSAYAYPAYKPIYNFNPPNIIKWDQKLGKMAEYETPTITTDQKWRAVFNYKGNTIIYCAEYDDRYGIIINNNGEAANKNAWTEGGINTLTPNQKTWDTPSKKLFEPTEPKLVEAYINSFKAELIYTGKMGNVITVSYREYVDNMARPAFFQDLRYDLTEGNDITFKSLKIKVLEATNSKINFQVIDDGGLPWVPAGGRI